tara:strand:- start:960 stop:1616 length:657 start_codon:yes stop_codon:yes gene_type:complete
MSGSIEAPGVYTFGSLLNRAVAGSKEYALLELFAYGTFGTYRAAGGAAAFSPPLSPAALWKLKQLSLATLAASTKVLGYATLQAELEIDSVAELERLIVESIYAGVVDGTIDQRAATFSVSSAMGRDVRTSDLGSLLERLDEWSQRSQDVVDALDTQIATFASDAAATRKRRENVTVAVQRQQRESSRKSKGGGGGGGGGGGAARSLAFRQQKGRGDR